MSANYFRRVSAWQLNGAKYSFPSDSLHIICSYLTPFLVCLGSSTGQVRSAQAPFRLNVTLAVKWKWMLWVCLTHTWTWIIFCVFSVPVKPKIVFVWYVVLMTSDCHPYSCICYSGFLQVLKNLQIRIESRCIKCYITCKKPDIF